MNYTYHTKGVCSQKIDLEVEDGILKDVRFTGGCNGNLKGISQLVKGMKIEETIVTSHIDLKKLLRRSIQVSADLLTETARYGQNVARILLETPDTDNRPLKHDSAAVTEEVILEDQTASAGSQQEDHEAGKPQSD